MIIAIDTREQLPFAFEGVATERRKLDAGDYSVVGLEEVVTVERKTLDDLAKSLITDRERFLDVVRRMERLPVAVVMVEGSLEDIAQRRYSIGAHREAVLGALLSLVVDHGVSVILAGDRPHARWCTQRLLEMVAERHQTPEVQP